MQNQTEEIINQLIEKQSDESPAAYTAFLFFANLPPSERTSEKSIPKVAAHVALEDSTIRVYRTSFKWDERANLLDAYFYKVQFDRRLALMEDSNLKFATETKKIQEKAVKVSHKSLDAADMLLNTLAIANKIKETDWVKVVQADGTSKTMPRTTQIFMEAKVSDIAPLIRVGVETPMKAIGLPTEIVRSNVVNNVSDISEMSDEDIALQREKLKREKDKLTGGTQNINTIQ